MINFDYLAGLMDADGHFTWSGGKYMAPDIGVTNTSQSLMLALTDFLGGSASPQRATCSDGCLDEAAHIHRRTDIWKWHLTGYRAVLVCRELAPRMVIKGAHAADLARQYDLHLVEMEGPARRSHHMVKEQKWWAARFGGA